MRSETTIDRTVQRKGERGYSILELLVAFGIASALSGIALYQMKDTVKPAQNGAAQLASEVKQIRAKALATTYAYRLRATNPNQVIAEYAVSCTAASFTRDSALTLTLPAGASMTDTTWTVCFAPRGVSLSSANIVIQDSKMSQTVQVALGGGVQIT